MVTAPNLNAIAAIRRKRKPLRTELIAILASSILFAAVADAATMSITGTDEVAVGDTFQVQILGDFTDDGLKAGGVALSWDNTLVQLVNITLDLTVRVNLSCPGSANCPAPTVNSATLAWGQFLNSVIASGDPAPTLMATITFTAVGSGTATFGMADIPALTGGWFDAEFVAMATPAFSDFSVCIVDTSSDPDPDNDGVSNCFDPDDDNDGIADELDTNPVVANNACTENDGTNATLVGESVFAAQTCASKESVDVSGGTIVGNGGDLRLISETVSLTDSSVTDNGKMEIINADPCPGCSVCGNGIVEAWEQCDDGNTLDGDGCSATCAIEE